MSAFGTTWNRLSLLATTGRAETPQTEEELCLAALSGDSRAWDALIRRHERRVIVALLARGIRVDRARDISQDAWARLIVQQRAGRLRKLTLPGLAVRQALFLAQEEARRARHRKPHVGLEHSGPTDHGFADRMLDRDRLERARAILKRQHPSAQRVFERLYAEPGIRHAEIAAELGLSVQRVRQIICEVRKLLRKELDR